MISLPYICFYLLSIFAIPYISRFQSRQLAESMEKSMYLAVLFLVFWGWGLVGYDTSAYYKMYYDVPNLREINYSDYEREYLFWTWCSLFRTLNFSYIAFRFVSSVVDIIVLFIFFSNFLKVKYFPIAFIFYLLYAGMYYELEAIRNAKAISCFLVSLIFFARKKYICFIILNIIAFYFHITILLLSVCTVFYPLFLNKKVNLIVFIVGCVLSVLGLGLSSLLERFGSSIPGIGFLIVRYLKSNMNHAHGLSIGFLERFVSFIIVYRLHNRFICDYANSKIFLAFFYIYIFFCFYFIDFTIVLERIAAMFKIAYWILFPLIYSYLTKKTKYLFFSVLLIYGVLKIVQQYNIDIYRFQLDLLK